MQKKSLLTIIIILFSFLGNCQYSDWTNYSFANSVNSLAEEDCLLWIATDVGIICLNRGNTIKTWYDHSNTILQDDRVLDVVIDKFHNKWFGTRNGLYRFNSEKWEIIDKDILNIGLNHIYALSIESDSIIWFYTKGVLWKYDQEFTSYKLDEIGLKYDVINCIAIDSLGNKWLGTDDHGVVKFNNKVLKQYNTANSKLPDNNVESIFIDSKERLFAGTWAGLFILSGNKQKVYKRFKYRDSRWSSSFSSDIENITEDKNGNIWLLTSNSGIRKYSKKGFTHYDYWNTDGKEINDPKCALFDSDNNMWLGTRSFGANLFKYDHDQWNYIIYTSFPIKSELFSVQMLEFDQEGNLWFGVNANYMALSKRSDKEWISLNGKDIGGFYSTERVEEMAIDSKGNRWFISDQGLHKYNGETWEVFRDYEVKKKKKIIHYDYSSIAIDSNDHIWIGTSSRGLFMFNNNTWVNYMDTNSAIPSNSNSCLTFDKYGDLWMKSGNTLTTFDLNERFTVYSSENSFAPNCKITKLKFDYKGDLWIGTYEHGMFKFDGKDFYSFGQINNTLESSKIINSNPTKYLKKLNPIFVTSGSFEAISDILFEDSTTIWIGTYGKGIVKIINGKISYLNMENSGLLTDRITKIAIDENGYKWVDLYRKGISKFK